MTTEPINITQAVEYIYLGVVMAAAVPSYTPPTGGYVLNDEAEWDATVWTDTTYTKPMWSDILFYNDAAYPWAEMQDILANWVSVESEANNSVSFAALTAILAAYLTTAGANMLYATPASILTTVLAGLSTATNSAITSSDSILSALGKIQAQITALSAKLARATSSFSLSLTGTGATGTQVSSTKDSTIRVNLSESVTSSIGGPAIAAIALKTCATNSTTETDWATVATFEEDQTITLAIALNSVQVMKGQLEADIPAGYYVKATSSGSGTNSESILVGQKTIYG